MVVCGKLSDVLLLTELTYANEGPSLLSGLLPISRGGLEFVQGVKGGHWYRPNAFDNYESHGEAGLFWEPDWRIWICRVVQWSVGTGQRLPDAKWAANSLFYRHNTSWYSVDSFTP